MKALKELIPPRIALPCVVMLILLPSCSSDLFNPTKDPEIQRLQLDKYEADPDEIITAFVSATDPKGKTLRYEWTVSGGQLQPPVDKPEVRWKLPAVGGVYQISVKVSNDEKSASSSVSATVRSPVNPDVQILTPSEGSHWTQHTLLSVSARASHDNGIARVDLFLNGGRQATLNGRTDGLYEFACPLEEPAGPARVRIEASANVTGRAGSDSVSIFIDGFVLGKISDRRPLLKIH